MNLKKLDLDMKTAFWLTSLLSKERLKLYIYKKIKIIS